MEQCKLAEVIREAAEHVAAVDGLSVPVVECFLRTGDETWDGAGSGRFTLAQLKEDEAYTRAAKAGLRTLLHLLASLLPAEAQSAPKVAPDMIRRRIEPMVKGLVQDDWQEIALREIIARTFILNFQGAKAAIDAELSTCFMGSAWRILWARSEIMGSSQKMLR